MPISSSRGVRRRRRQGRVAGHLALRTLRARDEPERVLMCELAWEVHTQGHWRLVKRDDGRPYETEEGYFREVLGLASWRTQAIRATLAEALVARGDEVHLIDDLSTGRVENLRAILEAGHVHAHWHSILDDGLLQELVDEVEIVYHLAAAVGVRLILDRPVETIETNILGTAKVLQCAAKGRKKVVLASSSEVYGKNDRVPLREDDDGLLGPTSKSRWSYACSKAIDEFLALAYWREMAVPVVILRYFNTIGPRQTGRYGMVVPRFIQQALRGEPITVYGDGSQSRSFTAVTDAVAVTIALALHPEAAGQVFNVGSGAEVTIVELAQRVKALTESPSPIVRVPYAEAYQAGFEDLRRRVPDIAKLRRFIQFEPERDLEALLTPVVEYHRQHPVG